MPEFRSQHLMPPAVSLIAEQVSDIDARWAIGFIREDNIPALKGAKRAGFRPYIERHERWRYFRRTVDFQPLHKPPYPFDHN